MIFATIRALAHPRILLRLTRNWVHFTERNADSVFGSVSEQDEGFLEQLVRLANKKSGPIIEVGSLFGQTTQLIATYKSPTKKLITIENFSWNPFCLPPETHQIILRRNLRYVIVHAQTELFEGSSTSFYKAYDGEPPALIFIDADHAYESVAVDIAFAIRAKASIVAGDDYSSNHPGVQQAVDEAFGSSVQIRGSIWFYCRGGAANESSLG